MNVDLSPLVDIFAPLAAAAITAGIPVALAYVRQHTNAKLSDDQWNKVAAECDAGAQAMYAFVAQHGASITNVPIHNAALAVGAAHVAAIVPAEIAKLGITPEQISAMVQARYGGPLSRNSFVTVADKTSPPVTGTTTIEIEQKAPSE